MAKRKHKDNALSIWIILLFVVLTVGGIVTTHSEKHHKKQGNDPFASVRRYKPLIQKILADHHAEEYTTVVLALMEQESKGRGDDPMQSSESAGLAPGSIQDPEHSIRQGIKHFLHVLAYGKKKNVDLPTILQAYNMGIGYINYVAKHGGHHSRKLAKQFSLIQVHKKPELYDCGGDRNNFRYPYCYGDFTYSSKVLSNIDSLQATAHAGNNEKTAE
ncbi:MAG TPA: lysozyme family protein [Bacillales bacterium]|nr:lysozyme family protein [Bacillales bacterium]